MQLFYHMSQNHQILIAESLRAPFMGRSRCENFGDRSCNCGYCCIDG